MAADLTRKRKSRGAYRTHCKRLEDEIINIISNYDPENSLTLTKVTALKSNYQTQFSPQEYFCLYSILILNISMEKVFDLRYQRGFKKKKFLFL